MGDSFFAEDHYRDPSNGGYFTKAAESLGASRCRQRLNRRLSVRCSRIVRLQLRQGVARGLMLPR